MLNSLNHIVADELEDIRCQIWRLYCTGYVLIENHILPKDLELAEYGFECLYPINTAVGDESDLDSPISRLISKIRNKEL